MLGRTAAVQMRPGPSLCPPVPTCPPQIHSPCPSICPSVGSWYLSCCCSGVCHSIFIARMQSVMLHTPLSQYHPSLFLSFILSPALLYFLCLLPPPNCCIPALPSDREGCVCVLRRACTIPVALYMYVGGAHTCPFLGGGMFACVFFVLARTKESIGQGDQSGSILTVSCISNKAPLLHPSHTYSRTGFDPLSRVVILEKGTSWRMKRTGICPLNVFRTAH